MILEPSSQESLHRLRTVKTRVIWPINVRCSVLVTAEAGFSVTSVVRKRNKNFHSRVMILSCEGIREHIRENNEFFSSAT